MYNNSRNQADKLCNVHYAQLTRHYFVEYAESLYRTPKKRPCSPPIHMSTTKKENEHENPEREQHFPP